MNKKDPTMQDIKARLDYNPEFFFRLPLRYLGRPERKSKLQKFSLFLREAGRNFINHGGKRMDVVDVDLKEISVLSFVACCSNSAPFESLEFMMECMRLNTSGSFKGGQGGGIKYSLMNLVSDPINAHYFWLSRCPQSGEWFMAQSKLEYDETSGVSIKISTVPVEQQNLILKALDVFLPKSNVIYLAAYENLVNQKAEVKFPSYDLARLATDFMPDIIEQMDVFFYPKLKLTPVKKPCASYEKVPFKLLTKQQFDNSFLFKEHVFDDIKITLEDSKNSIELTAKLVISHYDGLCWRTVDSSNSRRCGYIDKQKIKNLNQVKPLLSSEIDNNNTTVSFSNLFPDAVLSRLNKEPVGVFTYVEEIGFMLDVSLLDKHRDYNDIDDPTKPWYKAAMEYVKEHKSIPMRRPFQKAALYITKIDVNKSEIDNLNNPSLATLAVGPIDECFVCEKTEKLKQLIDKCCKEIKSNHKYQLTLNDLKETCDLISPIDREGYKDVTIIDEKSKYEKLNVYANGMRVTKVEAELKNHVRVSCDLKLGDNFIHPHEHQFVWLDHLGEISGHNKIEANKVLGNGSFTFTISPLIYKDGNSWHLADSKEQWLELSNYQSHLPCRDIYLMDEKTSKVYYVSLKIIIPERTRIKSKRKTTPDNDVCLPDTDGKVTVSVIKDFEPACQPVKLLSTGKLLINKRHPISNAFLLKIPGDRHIHLYKILKEYAIAIKNDFEKYRIIEPIEGIVRSSSSDNHGDNIGYSQTFDFYLTSCINILMKADKDIVKICENANAYS